jgi:D-arabinose 1-dehydrogenase-like Zn-dependent alcohol dehydrogenase
MFLLKIDGVMSNVGLLLPVSPHYGIVNIRRINLTGSIVGSIRDTQELVNFCAQKKIMPEVVVIPIDKVNEAYDRVMNKDVKFRFVIDMSTLL